MAVVVVDSTNLEQMLAEAKGEPYEKPAAEKVEAGEVSRETGEKAEKTEPAPKADDPDDIEGEDGLTPRQKRDFTQAMQRTIGKKTKQIKEAEEFAAHQYRELKEAERRAADLEERLRAVEAKAAPPKAEPTEPKRDQFATEAEFMEKLTKRSLSKGARLSRWLRKSANVEVE